MTDDTKDDTDKVDPKEQKEQRIVAAYNTLKAQGFNKEQAANSLSSKFAMTIADAKALIDRQDGDEQKEEDK